VCGVGIGGEAARHWRLDGNGGGGVERLCAASFWFDSPREEDGKRARDTNGTHTGRTGFKSSQRRGFLFLQQKQVTGFTWTDGA
jgi:hypothetical protein